MTALRTRKTTGDYQKYLSHHPSGVCDFCSFHTGDKQVVSETTFFYVVRALFPYSHWDSQEVVDHLMIIPKRHTDSLKGLTPAAAVEYVDLVGEYQQQSYNIYTRAPGSKAKTVEHQHTHLIKTTGNLKRVVLMVRRPYIPITF